MRKEAPSETQCIAQACYVCKNHLGLIATLYRIAPLLILSRSSTFCRMEEMKDEPVDPVLQAWHSSATRNIDWAREGVSIAKLYYEKNSLTEAIQICDRVIEVLPNFHKAKIRRCWCLYLRYIKRFPRDGGFSVMKSAAEYIMSVCKRMEPYTPYVLTALSMTDYYLAPVTAENDSLHNVELSDAERRESNNKAEIWFSKIDETGLDRSYITYTDRFDREGVWSQYSKYLLTKKRLLIALGRFEEAAWIALRIIRECNFTKATNLQVDPHFALSEADQYMLRGLFGSEALHSKIEIVLKHSGFRDVQRTAQYKRALLQCIGDDPDNLSPGGERRLHWRLVEEYLCEQCEVVVERDLDKKFSAVTEISDFCFCPASAVINATFEFPQSDRAEIGTLMHEKQLLVAAQMKSLSEPFRKFAYHEQFVSGKNLSEYESLRPLLDDISQAKLIVDGHGDASKKPVLLYNNDKKLVGCPDYVFERKDGTRFVVEEKFSHSPRKCDWEFDPQACANSKNYLNHRAQVYLYISCFSEISCSHGYIVHWLYDLARDVEEPFAVLPGNLIIPRYSVHAALVYNVQADDHLLSRIVDAALTKYGALKRGDEVSFNTSKLRESKCVQCVRSMYCRHKSGEISSLQIPYKHFHPRNLIAKSQTSSFFDNYAEGLAAAKKNTHKRLVGSADTGWVLR